MIFQEKIAKGEVVRPKHDYPTMNDVLSDWETVDQQPQNQKSDGKKKSKPKK